MKKNRVFVSMIVIFVGSISCSGEDYDSDIPALMEDDTTAVSDTADQEYPEYRGAQRIFDTEYNRCQCPARHGPESLMLVDEICYRW